VEVQVLRAVEVQVLRAWMEPPHSELWSVEVQVLWSVL
jgi:hypothetical protein